MTAINNHTPGEDDNIELTFEELHLKLEQVPEVLRLYREEIERLVDLQAAAHKEWVQQFNTILNDPQHPDFNETTALIEEAESNLEELTDLPDATEDLASEVEYYLEKVESLQRVSSPDAPDAEDQELPEKPDPYNAD